MRALLGALFFGAVAGLLAGCLEPLASDEIGIDQVFGDPRIAPAELPHVEDNPELAKKVALFPDRVPYLKGFAKGQPIWYWHVPGVPPDFIVPYYVVVELDGSEHAPIIDVIPGDAGYSPWWRRVEVHTTAKYAGERIWSRAAVDMGVRMKILEEPRPTTAVVTCPVVQRAVRVQVDPMGTAEVAPTWAFYRNQRVSWIAFSSSTIEVAEDVRRMPSAPIYVLRRVNEQMPLFEYANGIDMNGDGKLTASNNIFAARNGDAGYSPMWYAVGVHVVADYVSFDTVTASTSIGLTDERQFVGPSYDVVVSELVVPPLDVERDALEVCPIQKDRGAL